MAYNIIAKISLDLYNDNFVIVNAKQGDSESRYIEVTATEYGVPYFVDKDTVVAYIRCCKPDGKYSFNKAIILDDGKILIKLTEQMLAVGGRGVIDLTLTSVFTGESINVDTTSDIVVIDDGAGNATLDIQNVSEEETEIDDGTRLAVLSTMSFYLNVCSNPMAGADIESTSEYNALNDILLKVAHTEESFTNTFDETVSGLKDVETELEALNAEVRSNEDDRILAEQQRETDVNNAISEMIKVTDEAIASVEGATNTSLENIETAISNANTATNNANNAANSANTATQDANTATSSANTAASAANEAADRANAAAETCEGIADTTGLVLKTQIADNLETTDANYVLSANQGTVLYEITESLRLRIEGMHNVWSGTSDPNTDDGSNGASKNGDIYMQIIES